MLVMDAADATIVYARVSSSEPTPLTLRFGLNSNPQIVCPVPELVPGLSNPSVRLAAVCIVPVPDALPVKVKFSKVNIVAPAVKVQPVDPKATSCP